ncbi:acyltransferase [Acidihalobacter aeolianus]|uniref:Acyltransferase n=1 Tax=Acidihalobacter aeolianus TaxID=2792603 RepID=A0A1D8K994_9GAMM|nr:carbon-nitrogen hydrolase family protein [Acidihalobacter aeolianus]AOV17544.1 acyltransferase [Acidihalobacter aeolianus]
MKNTKVAAIQMASGSNREANLLEAARLLREAAQAGARLAVLPESFDLMARTDAERAAAAEVDGVGPVQDFLAAQARKHGLWLVGGTIPLRSDEPGRAYASCLVFDPRGQRAARYDKIHLFDVSLSASGEEYRESATTVPGDTPVTVETELGCVGLAVCYDLRFPELFHRLRCQGAELFVLPSAFTAVTGQAHWSVLLRARAIENLSYMIAAAQGGFHVSGRETYGHSQIIDTWGNVLASRAGGAGVVVADIDLAQQRRIRGQFPTLEHHRLAMPAVTETL